nr:transposase, MuDR, MULE transposase domain protein [Tanacetum cinerariifolium]
MYEGTNLVAVGMDDNNQIIPIATGVSQGETGPSWTWFLSKLKEYIGEIPNLTIISDTHAAILSSCEAVFLNAFHGYCYRHLMMNCKLKSIKIKLDVYEKLIEAGVERWSKAYCPRGLYNYMTWYKKLLQRWFGWVYFLKSKDETTLILKDFIRHAENQFNPKVKTIRSDNGTEFKNNDLIEFCGLKWIKREYSNARTQKQNGVAERKNRTLIEAARTMLADSFLPTTF